MNTIHTQEFPFGISILFVTQVLALLFIAITFLETGFNKLLNYRGGLAYFTDHFKNSVLAKSVPILFPVILVQEIVTGFMAVGSIVLLFDASAGPGILTFLLATLTFLNLYFGQRVAKDYVGASGLVPYIIASLGGLVLFMM